MATSPLTEEQKRAAEVAAQAAQPAPVAPPPNPGVVDSPLTPNELQARSKMGGLVEQYQNADSGLAKVGTGLNMMGTTLAAGARGLADGSIVGKVADAVGQGASAFWNSATSNPTESLGPPSPAQPTGLSQVPPALKPQAPPPAAPLATQPATAPAQAGWQQFDQRFGGITTPQDGGYLLNGKNVTQPATVMSAPLGATPAAARPAGSPLTPTPASGPNAQLEQQAMDFARKNEWRVDKGYAPLESPFDKIAVGNTKDTLGQAKLMQDQQQFVATQEESVRANLLKGFNEANPDDASLTQAYGMGVPAQGLATLASMPPEARTKAITDLQKEQANAAKKRPGGEPPPDNGSNANDQAEAARRAAEQANEDAQAQTSNDQELLKRRKRLKQQRARGQGPLGILDTTNSAIG